MFCRLSEAHSAGGPHVVGRWPWTYYVRVRNAMIRAWKDQADAMRRAQGKDDNVRVIEM